MSQVPSGGRNVITDAYIILEDGSTLGSKRSLKKITRSGLLQYILTGGGHNDLIHFLNNQPEGHRILFSALGGSVTVERGSTLPPAAERSAGALFVLDKPDQISEFNYLSGQVPTPVLNRNLANTPLSYKELVWQFYWNDQNPQFPAGANTAYDGGPFIGYQELLVDGNVRALVIGMRWQVANADAPLTSAPSSFKAKFGSHGTVTFNDTDFANSPDITIGGFTFKKYSNGVTPEQRTYLESGDPDIEYFDTSDNPLNFKVATIVNPDVWMTLKPQAPYVAPIVEPLQFRNDLLAATTAGRVLTSTPSRAVKQGEVYAIAATTKLQLNSSDSSPEDVTIKLTAQIGSGNEEGIREQVHRQVDHQNAEDRHQTMIKFYTIPSDGDLVIRLKLISSDGGNEASHSDIDILRFPVPVIPTS